MRRRAAGYRLVLPIRNFTVSLPGGLWHVSRDRSTRHPRHAICCRFCCSTVHTSRKWRPNAPAAGTAPPETRKWFPGLCTSGAPGIMAAASQEICMRPIRRSLTERTWDVSPDDLVGGMHEILFDFEDHGRVQSLRHARTQQTEEPGATDHHEPIVLTV